MIGRCSPKLATSSSSPPRASTWPARPRIARAAVLRGCPVCQAVRVPILAGVTVLAAVAWVYLLAGHGGYWRTDQRLPGGGPDPATRPKDSGPSESWPNGSWPSVVAVIPARNEAAVLPLSLPSLVAQDYPGAVSYKHLTLPT